MINDDIIIDEVPLISFKDAEDFETSEPHPQLSERSRLFRKKMILFLSKGSFFAVGLLAVVVGCVFLLSFQHEDVTEMCTLGEEDNSSAIVPAGSLTPPTPSMPLPTSTLTNQYQLTTSLYIN